jgi:hypothetical protein
MTDKILLSRLLKYYDPVTAMEMFYDLNGALRQAVKSKTIRAKVQPTYQPGVNECPSWHLGRVRHFVDLLLSGAKVEPIEVDNEWSGTTPVGPIIIDGHHRIVAHMIARKQRINIKYSGWTDFLDYMTGKTDSKPDFET